LKERGFKLYLEGKPNPEIAGDLGIPLMTLARWSSNGKWKTQKLLAQGGSVDAIAAVDTSEFENLSLDEKQVLYEEIMSNRAIRFAKSLEAMPDAQFMSSADKIKKLDEVVRKALKLDGGPKPACIVQIALLSTPAEKRAVIDI
jgi:uncharacterized protein YjcR